MKQMIEGVMRFRRSQGEDADKCVCCEGAHVFNRYLEIVPRVSRFPGLTVTTLDEAVYEALCLVPENRNVKITIEFID